MQAAPRPSFAFPSNGAIPVDAFVESVTAISPILSLLGTGMTMASSEIEKCARGGRARLPRPPPQTRLRPVRARARPCPRRNVRKISTANDQNIYDLDSLLAYERVNKKNAHDLSATVGLLWTYRALKYVEELLRHLGEGKEVSAAASAAYADTLSQYHQWTVRNMFKLSFKIMPSTHTWLSELGPDPAAVSTDLMVLYADLKQTNVAIAMILDRP